MPRKKTAKRKVTMSAKRKAMAKTFPKAAKAQAKTVQASVATGLVLQLCSDVTKIRELLEALQLHIEPIKPGKKSRKKPHESPQN
jgi:hypothetical protein